MGPCDCLSTYLTINSHYQGKDIIQGCKDHCRCNFLIGTMLEQRLLLTGKPESLGKEGSINNPRFFLPFCVHFSVCLWSWVPLLCSSWWSPSLLGWVSPWLPKYSKFTLFTSHLPHGYLIVPDLGWTQSLELGVGVGFQKQKNPENLRKSTHCPRNTINEWRVGFFFFFGRIAFLLYTNNAQKLVTVNIFNDFLHLYSI